jgi:tape measure domain-containing protein
MTRAITVPLAGLGALAVKSAADLEKLEASFVSLTGGVDQAAAMMKQLNEFTASTPFQIENVANAARQLIASGTEIGEVNNQLRFLGDIAATSGVTIEEIAAIFAKVNAKGKVELENLNQLAERGIPIFKALADATGLPADSLGAGAVSVEQFNTVLKSFAEEGGFAAGAMERLSQTAAGQFSTALDNLKLAGASIGELLLPAVNSSASAHY